MIEGKPVSRREIVKNGRKLAGVFPSRVEVGERLFRRINNDRNAGADRCIVWTLTAQGMYKQMIRWCRDNRKPDDIPAAFREAFE